MYKILNIPRGEYFRYYSYISVPGFSYYWHESLIVVDGNKGDLGMAKFFDHADPDYIIEQALKNYRMRMDIFLSVCYDGYSDYQAFEFEVIHF